MNPELAEHIAHERARREAIEAVTNRLSLVSAIIWGAGVALIPMAVLVWASDPWRIWKGWWLIMGVAMFLPASLPWRSYYQLIDEGTQRRASEYDNTPSDEALDGLKGG